MKTDYEKQADEFLLKTNTKIDIQFLKYDYHFQDDKEKRDIYKITIKRGNRQFSFNFGNSIINSGAYIGHKHLCLNSFGKYLFSENDFSKLRLMDKEYNEIVKNPNFKIPTNYDVLACLTKYDVGSFSDFCSEFGYDEDSRKAEKIYISVVEEYKNVCTIWSDEEIEFLQEIS